MKSSLSAYYETLSQPVPTLLVQQEITALEIAIANAIRAGAYNVVHNALVVGNPLIANASGEIEPGVLSVVQKDFLLIVQASGYEVSRDVLTGRWMVSWERGNSIIPPNASAARSALGVGGSFSTGDVKFTFKIVAESGWIMVNDGTIGSTASGATTRANNDTLPLYELIWINVSNTYAAVSGGRGVTAGVDFDAHKTLAIPKALGRVLGIAGAGSTLTLRNLGQILGTETHALTAAENGPHSHSLPDAYPGANTGGSWQTNGGGFGGSISGIGSSGSGTPHNTMQPTSFWNAMIKL